MSYKFISKQTTFPSFFQYPEFLLNLPISQTGKIIYMLLYDRARLSQKNNWMDENGRIFVIFPVKELAKKLEKSETTIKTALNELDEAGLLHCDVCKEALEGFYPRDSLLEGRKPHRQCACERNAHAENERYYKEKEHRELVNRNRNICFGDR